jgi:hypothetical protein
MTEFKTNYKMFEEKAQELNTNLRDSTMPEKTKALLAGSICSCRDYARKGKVEVAKNLLENIAVYVK